ncbi:MAG: dihydroxyacetone kinase phosphoryl donor subunit DhaM [Chloroflexota bacterium]
MVNLVIVSHSLLLAQGVKQLSDEMINTGSTHEIPSSHKPKIVAVGGVKHHGSWGLGTNSIEIAEAIRRVWSHDGVLILADLGSALINAEMAIEFLDEPMRDRCLVSNAPLVEGSVIASMEASLGKTLSQVEEAANAACQLVKTV